MLRKCITTVLAFTIFAAAPLAWFSEGRAVLAQTSRGAMLADAEEGEAGAYIDPNGLKLNVKG